MAGGGLEEVADVRVAHVFAAADLDVPKAFAGAFEPVGGVRQVNTVAELEVDDSVVEQSI